MTTAPILTRRTFLKVSAAAGGGFLICGSVSSVASMSTVSTEVGREEAAAGSFEPNVWVKIAADNTVTVTLTQLEMGQGVMTSMPMLVAEELDVDWNRIEVVWTREDDIQHDYYRPVTYVRMWGAVDGSGKPVAFMQRLVQQLLMKRTGGLPPNGVDYISVDGSASLPYDIPNVRIEYIEVDPGIPFGFWRSVGASVNGFVVEAFVDELAAAAGEDPFAFRHTRLDKHPRHKAVLELVAGKSGWGQPLPAGHARGIALMEAFGSIVGQVAEVSVTDGTVRVHKIWCAVDCGWVIHPDTIKAQMEGGTVYGLTAALKGEITIQNGRVVQRHFNDYQMIRHNDAPEVETHIVASAETPGGIGEPSTAVAAGALVNAIAAATGKRIYRLPIRPEQLRS